MPQPNNDAKRLELNELNDSIAERSKYRREQEKLISEMVEVGNTQLMELNHDIELAKKERRELKTDVRALKRDKGILTGDIEALRQELSDPGMAYAYA